MKIEIIERNIESLSYNPAILFIEQVIVREVKMKQNELMSE